MASVERALQCTFTGEDGIWQAQSPHWAFLAELLAISSCKRSVEALNGHLNGHQMLCRGPRLVVQRDEAMDVDPEEGPWNHTQEMGGAFREALRNSQATGVEAQIIRVNEEKIQAAIDLERLEVPYVGTWGLQAFFSGRRLIGIAVLEMGLFYQLDQRLYPRDREEYAQTRALDRSLDTGRRWFAIIPLVVLMPNRGVRADFKQFIQRYAAPMAAMEMRDPTTKENFLNNVGSPEMRSLTTRALILDTVSCDPNPPPFVLQSLLTQQWNRITTAEHHLQSSSASVATNLLLA
jgi:hypothetical protein